MLTECLHIVIKVLAVDQLPRSAESLNHFALITDPGPALTIGQPLLSLQLILRCLSAKLILYRRAGLGVQREK